MTDKNNSSTQRIIDRLDAYARFRNLTDAEITRECSLAVGTLGKSRKPGKDISRRVAAIFLDHYTDINRQWFMNGEGEMMRDNRRPDFTTFPLIDTTRAECGRTGGLAEAALAENLPVVGLPGIPRETDFFIQATGYSMTYPERPELSIPPGALVGVSKINERQSIRWGEVYMVSTVDGVMIKKLLQDTDAEFVRCSSYNREEYPEFRMRKDEILECGRITCVIPVYLR